MGTRATTQMKKVLTFLSAMIVALSISIGIVYAAENTKTSIQQCPHPIEYYIDDELHFIACNICGCETTAEAHTFVNNECIYCGYVTADSEKHVHHWTMFSQSPDGSTMTVVCHDCRAQINISAQPCEHTLTEWRSCNTEIAPGLHEMSCDFCGYYIRMPHEVTNHLCVCGYSHNTETKYTVEGHYVTCHDCGTSELIDHKQNGYWIANRENSINFHVMHCGDDKCGFVWSEPHKIINGECTICGDQAETANKEIIGLLTDVSKGVIGWDICINDYPIFAVPSHLLSSSNEGDFVKAVVENGDIIAIDIITSIDIVDYIDELDQDDVLDIDEYVCDEIEDGGFFKNTIIDKVYNLGDEIDIDFEGGYYITIDTDVVIIDMLDETQTEPMSCTEAYEVLDDSYIGYAILPYYTEECVYLIVVW